MAQSEIGAMVISIFLTAIGITVLIGAIYWGFQIYHLIARTSKKNNQTKF